MLHVTHTLHLRSYAMPRLYIPLVGIRDIQELHRLFIHGEYNSSAQSQSDKPRQSARPKGKDALITEDLGGTDEAVLILGPSRDRLHPGLDSVEGLCHISDQ